MSFESDLLGEEIPLADASAFFIKLKYGSAYVPQPDPEDVFHHFERLPSTEQEVILKEAGVQRKPTLVKKASLFEKNLAYVHKLAEEIPSMEEYMAQEQQGVEAERTNEDGFLRDRVQELQEQLQVSQESSQAAAQQLQGLQQQVAESQTQIQSAQQAAMMAQQQATQAQQQQMTATDQAMQTQQLAGQMRVAYQQLRSQMMDIASQDPAQQIGDQLKGQMPGMPGMGPEALGQPGAQPQVDANGQPVAPPSGAAPPGAPAEAGAAPGATPPPEAPPPAPPGGGAGGASPPPQEAKAPETSQKTGSRIDVQRAASKTASFKGVPALFRKAAAKENISRRQNLKLAAGEAPLDSPSPESVIEEAPKAPAGAAGAQVPPEDSPGIVDPDALDEGSGQAMPSTPGGFGQALDMAKAKLAFRKLLQRHSIPIP